MSKLDEEIQKAQILMEVNSAQAEILTRISKLSEEDILAVFQNLSNPNTDPLKVRKINYEVSFKRSASGEILATVHSKKGLCPVTTSTFSVNLNKEDVSRLPLVFKKEEAMKTEERIPGVKHLTAVG